MDVRVAQRRHVLLKERRDCLVEWLDEEDRKIVEGQRVARELRERVARLDAELRSLAQESGVRPVDARPR